MYRIFHIFKLVLFCHVLYGQCGFNTVLIENDNRQYLAGSAGQLMDAQSGSQSFYQSDNYITDIGFIRGLFFSGFDFNGNVKFAAAKYNSASNIDFEPGILDPNGGSPYFDNACEYQDWIWKFTAEEINLLKQEFMNGTLTVDKISDDIISYPGKANPYYETTYGKSINFELAPFNDFNQDGIYNPLDGDTPIVILKNPSFLPYEFSYTIFHDNRIHTFSITDPLRVEVHQTNYVLKSVDQIANNTVFTRLVIFNRSFDDILDFRICIFNDTDLGSSEDDFIGCDTLLNMQYAYNHGINGLAKDAIWPINGIQYLNLKMSSFIVENPQTIPSVPEALPINTYFPILNGSYENYGQPTVGGSGIDHSSEQRTKFMFHDTPNKEGWSMYDLPDSLLFEQRSYTSFDIEDTYVDTIVPHPINFSPNNRIILDFADFAYYDSSLDSIQIFDHLSSISNKLFDLYEEHLGVFSVSTKEQEASNRNTNITLFPNPNEGVFQINLSNTEIGRLEIFDGLVRLQNSISISDKNAKVQLNLSSFPAGIYFIRFIDQSNNISSKKVIIK